jgi:hypothetical protein
VHSKTCILNSADISRYPKFLSASYVKVGDDGVAHAALIPTKLTTTLQNGSNEVEISCETTYPFGTALNYTISATKPFFFYLRVPEWAILEESHIQLNGKTLALEPDISSGLHKLPISTGITNITYTLIAKIIVTPRANDTITITYGAILYALEVGESVTDSYPLDSRNQRPIPAKWTTSKSQDHQIRNTTAWNIAIDPTTLYFHSEDVTALANPLFTSGGPPTYMTALGCEIAWELYKGTAAPPPMAGERDCLGDFFIVKLVPYGSSKLHMAQLPTVNSKNAPPKLRLLVQEL